MVSLVGRDAETGASWAFPPTIFLSVMLDHQVILQNMKHTIAYFLERVRGPPAPSHVRLLAALGCKHMQLPTLFCAWLMTLQQRRQHRPVSACPCCKAWQ